MIFALLGEESFLLHRSLEKLLAERLPKTSRDFNYDVIDGADAQGRKVMDMAGTLPVFATRRVILIRNADQMKKGEMEKLEPHLAAIPETTDLILTAEKPDRRLTFWKSVEKSAKVLDFKPLSPREIPSWISEESTKAGYRVAFDAAQWMGTALGTDLSLIHSTLQKLFLLKGEQKSISLADVESCVVAFSWKSVFDLTDAVSRRDSAKALALFHRMSSGGESPVGLVAILARHFRILSKVKEGNSAGVPPFFLKDYQKQAGEFSSEVLNDKREKIFQTDWSLKSSPIPVEIVFERLVMDLCSG